MHLGAQTKGHTRVLIKVPQKTRDTFTPQRTPDLDPGLGRPFPASKKHSV